MRGLRTTLSILTTFSLPLFFLPMHVSPAVNFKTDIRKLLSGRAFIVDRERIAPTNEKGSSDELVRSVPLNLTKQEKDRVDDANVPDHNVSSTAGNRDEGKHQKTIDSDGYVRSVIDYLIGAFNRYKKGDESKNSLLKQENLSNKTESL